MKERSVSCILLRLPVGSEKACASFPMVMCMPVCSFLTACCGVCARRGVGSDSKGNNLLGVLLGKLREELLAEEQK